MTEDELKYIISEVLKALQTNSKTIDQLTAIEILNNNDYFEVNGGRKVSYSVLKDLIVTLSKDSVSKLISNNTLKQVYFTVTDNTATLSIQSYGKEISVSVPIADSNTAGLITAEDKDVIVKLKPLIQNLNELSSGSGVTEFWAVENFEDTVQNKTDKGAEDEGCLVVYSPGHSAFFLRVPTGFTALYYKTWNGSSQWNRWLDSAGGYRPRANKLYVCVSDNGALYWWNSSELIRLGMNSEELEALQKEIEQLGVRNKELGDKCDELESRNKELGTEVQNLTEQVTNVEDVISNLATINGKSLLDGGDIVITGDGVMIEPIPEEDIKNLGDY